MIKSKKFVADVGITFIASIASAIIALPITIILGRYLGAEDLGIYRMVYTIYGIVMLFAAIGIPAAIIKYVAEYQDDEEKVCRIISSGVFVSIILGFIFFITLFYFSNGLANIFDMPELNKLIRILSLVFPFSLVGSTLLATLNGFRRMKMHAYATIIQSILMLCSTVLLIYIGYGVFGVIIGIVISSIGSCLYLIWILKIYFVKLTITQFINNSKMMLYFGGQTLIANSINMINYQADTLMVGYFLTKTDVGFYAVAVVFAKLLWLIPDSIQRITYPMISEYHGKKRHEIVRQVVTLTMKYTACISVIIGTSMMIFAKPIITMVFGISFIESLQPFYILVVGTMIFGIVKSVNSLFASIGRADLFAKIPAVSAIFNIALNLLLIPIYGITGAAMATMASLLVYVIFMMYYMKKLLKITPDIFWYTKASILIISLISINNVLVSFIPLYISGIVTIIFGIAVMWIYLLNSGDHEYLSTSVGISNKK